MSSTNVQLVKWSFPAFALLIGLLWYKRRRVDRVDPGGGTPLVSEHKESVAGNSESGKSSSRKNVANGGASSLCDSGIHIDESFSLNTSSQPSEELICSPRRVSESLDIPRRRSSSHPISAQSGKSSPDSQAWYKDVDTLPETMDVQLGSNPRTSNFEMLVRSRGGSSFVADSKMPRVFENLAEDEERKNVVPEVTPVTTAAEDEPQNEENARAAVDVEPVCIRKDTQPQEDRREDQSQSDAKTQAQALSERDSANHSPVSGVLEGSVTDEVRSEGSTDSGKGGSIRGHVKDTASTVYEFSIPQNLVGRLIGRHGSFLQQIRAKAEVHIVIKRHSTSREFKVCTIEGSVDGITQALEIIREKFPVKKFPEVTLEQLSLLTVPEQIPWVADLMQLSLVEGVNNDVIVCHILKPNRVFVQLPTHPTYPSLRILDANMTQLYNTTDSPAVPDQLTRGMIVVAKWYDRWIRVYVENPDPLGERHLVRSVDHGGYWTFSSADMRKIRSDYLTLPFQAIEVLLANIQPKDGEWKQEAYDVVAQICSGVVGQAQIEGYIDTNTYINLYVNIPKHGVISLADELVARGFAEPVPLEETAPEENVSVS